MNELLILWITFSGLAVVAVATVLVWAARTRQFSQQDRARYLALTSGIPKSGAPARARIEGILPSKNENDPRDPLASKTPDSTDKPNV